MTDHRELRHLAEQTTAAALSDALVMLGRGNYQHEIIGTLPQATGTPLLFGEAVTLRSLPVRPDLMADLLDDEQSPQTVSPFEQALSQLDEDKVLVVACAGYPQAIVGGDTSCSRVLDTPAAGLITDGLLRNKRDFMRKPLPFYSAGFSPCSGPHSRLYPHDVNVPVSCGGATVMPGDYVLGDGDGLVVIPRDVVKQALLLAVHSQVSTAAAINR